MLTTAQFEHTTARANLALSVHHTQPARWRMIGEVIEITADLSISLPHADPDNRDIGLSCGTALEATILALSAQFIGANVTDLWGDDDRRSWPCRRMVARLNLKRATRQMGFMSSSKIASHAPPLARYRRAHAGHYRRFSLD